ncbi:MAG TPA: NAD-dependent epimerase/dehydratase family protein, partial [Ignavibacteriaceae bacterium]
MCKHNILITGGGGFIGTQVAHELETAGHNVTIVDRKNPVHYFGGIFHIDDYLEFLKRTEQKFDTIIHLAAEHLVEQSVSQPEKYYAN